MKKDTALTLSAAIFAIVALMHLARIFLNWPVTISKFNVPIYFSYIGFIVAGCLAWVMHVASK
ncbi:MAG TPA: hypothetical protein VJI97_04250 [Candidatus Nanoarchaeia archaeon]|nr:hypothetical protein [Candidatus Nanoarchaeia archaeon]